MTGQVYPRARIGVPVLVNLAAPVAHRMIRHDILGELPAGGCISRPRGACRELRPWRQRPARACNHAVEEPLWVDLAAWPARRFTVDAGVGYRLISDLELRPQAVGQATDAVGNGARRQQPREAHIHAVVRGDL